MEAHSGLYYENVIQSIAFPFTWHHTFLVSQWKCKCNNTINIFTYLYGCFMGVLCFMFNENEKAIWHLILISSCTTLHCGQYSNAISETVPPSLLNLYVTTLFMGKNDHEITVSPLIKVGLQLGCHFLVFSSHKGWVFILLWIWDEDMQIMKDQILIQGCQMKLNSLQPQKQLMLYHCRCHWCA